MADPMFVTEKAALAGALAATKDAAKAKNTIPILSNVLFGRVGERLTVTGSNLDMEISASFAAEIGAGFLPFTCPADPLTSFVKSVPDGFDVRATPIMSDDGMVAIQVTAGKSRIRLMTLPASDFPSIGGGNYDRQFSLTASHLARALSGVVFAVETNEQRYVQCGVLFEPDEKGVAVAASDGNRMAKRVLRAAEFDDPPGEFDPIIIPTGAVNAIIRMLDKVDDVSIDVSDHKVRVTTNEVQLVSKLIEGKFIPYRAAVQSPDAISVRVNAKALHDAVARVLTVNSDKKSGISVDVRDDALRLLSRDAADGEAEDEVPAVAAGRARNGFNGEYLKAALHHIGSEEIDISMSSDRGPLQITPAGDTDGLAVLKLGPMRVFWSEEAAE